MTAGVRAIVSHLATAAREAGERVAVVCGDAETTYSELWSQSLHARDWYRERGLERGERIVLSVEASGANFAPSYFGAHLAGLVVAPVSARMSPARIAERLQALAPATAISAADVRELGEEFARTEVVTTHDPSAFPALEETADIMFTTGSTGVPKGVVLSHGNLAASADIIRRFVGNGPDDVEIMTAPLTHSFGLGRLRAVIAARGSIVIVPGVTFPQVVFNAAADHAATGLTGVPAVIRILIARGDEQFDELATQLRYVELGSAPMTGDEKRALSARLPSTRICMHYGLTEASRSTFLEFREDEEDIASVGRASPGVELEVRGADGETLAAGQTGTVFVRAPTVMQGYWRDSQRTAAVLDAETGWLETGDLGYLNDRGYLYFVGRADDTINCGAEKVLPGPLEDFVGTLDGVDDVGVVGVDDPTGLLGQVPVICVSSRAPVDTAALRRLVLREFVDQVRDCRIVAVDTLPRAENGKLLRSRLREHVAEMAFSPTDG